MEAYASGLDYHLSDDDFCAFFFAMPTRLAIAPSRSSWQSRFDWDLNRLKLLKKSVRKDALVLIDANEGWGAKEALTKLESFARRATTCSGWKIRSCATIIRAENAQDACS